jgi:dimethylargininase
MLIGLVRSVSPKLASCELTYVAAQPMDPVVASRQHDVYVETLRRHGAEIVRAESLPDHPDGVFVEDTAVVLDEVAVIARPTLSRRDEVQSVADVLAKHRQVKRISEPATLEGGDVFRAERTIFVGLTTRTNPAGVDQLRGFVEGFGYEVRAVPVTGVLHLKSACTYVGRKTIIANPRAVDRALFAGFDVIDVPASEPGGAEALSIGDSVVVPASFPMTAALLRDRGFEVETFDMSELQKAEAGVTCMSILFKA